MILEKEKTPKIVEVMVIMIKDTPCDFSHFIKKLKKTYTIEEKIPDIKNDMQRKYLDSFHYLRIFYSFDL